MKWILFFILLTGALGAKIIFVEHAVTEQQRLKGLMGVKSLPLNHGMLFHFSNEGYYPFWGWGCYLDFGVAYLDKSGQVLEIARLETFPTNLPPDFGHEFVNKSYFPKRRATYILEMQWDWFKKVSLSIDDRVLIDPSKSQQEISKSNKIK